MTASDPAPATGRGAAEGPRRAGRYPIAVLAKALDLLDELEAHESLTLTELSAHAGVNKTTALRVLANLEERGYVERDAATGRYRLGYRLLQLGVRKSRGLDLRTVARPILQRLQAEFDETVNLAVPDRDGIVYIDIVESARGLRMAATIGQRDDYHSSSLGKAIMAWWPASILEDFVRRHPLARKTPRTVVEPAALASELAHVRARGYAVDDEENELGARCVGAPVFDHRGGVVAAISVAGPASRLTPDRVDGLGSAVAGAGRHVSALMGFDGAGPSPPVNPAGATAKGG